MSTYERYVIPTESAPNIAPHPNRFRVDVKRHMLASHLLKELIHRKADMPVVTSRPCVYGVYSGPIGGFAARPVHCVGCLRCTIEHPEVTQILPNPDRLQLGDTYSTPDVVDTLVYEAATGHVPVRGAGYRGTFGGYGWDDMWTDMSEIVRPTRDGIHGREFISTTVDIGEKPPHLILDPSGEVVGESPRVISLQIPVLFDVLPHSVESHGLYGLIAQAARTLQTLAVVPTRWILRGELRGREVVPLVRPDEVEEVCVSLPPPAILELDGWDRDAYTELAQRFPETLVCVRMPFTEDVLPVVESGSRILHLTADYHGQTGDGFVLDAIREVHDAMVSEGMREQVTLIGSGGIIAAEHVAKAIVCGLDAVALDTPLLVALQARFRGECVSRESAPIRLPRFGQDWGVQRLLNLMGSWRDQLLEVLGAMGLREVRRLRGEVGRAMFREDVEREAFSGIQGYEV